MKLRGPFEYEDDRVSPGKVLGIVQREFWIRRTVYHHLVAHGAGRARVTAQVQHAASVLEAPVDENQLHRASVLQRADQFIDGRWVDQVVTEVLREDWEKAQRP